jgi:predicted acyltransferase
LVRRTGAPQQPLVYAVLGVILFAAGMLVSAHYPPIKKLWTATFDVMAIGASLMLLAASMSLFDAGRARRAGVFFAVIGANAILIYMAARYFAYPLFKILANGEIGAPLRIVGVALITTTEWLILYALYRRRIFLRV